MVKLDGHLVEIYCPVCQVAGRARYLLLELLDHEGRAMLVAGCECGFLSACRWADFSADQLRRLILVAWLYSQGALAEYERCPTCARIDVDLGYGLREAEGDRAARRCNVCGCIWHGREL